MFAYGSIGGKGLNMGQLRPTVIKAQDEMKAAYEGAWGKAHAKPGAAAALDRVAQLPEKPSKKEAQPGGKDLTVQGLYEGAMGASGALWSLGERVAEASGEEGVAMSWGLKKAQRVWFKLSTKYGKTTFVNKRVANGAALCAARTRSSATDSCARAVHAHQHFPHARHPCEERARTVHCSPQHNMCAHRSVPSTS
eukprot:3543226-Prymnesium_polylepis.1